MRWPGQRREGWVLREVDPTCHHITVSIQVQYG